jgi:5'-nucleotidase/UDP-sugar diphosphatase
MARWASLVEKRRRERAVLVVDTGDFSLNPDARRRDLIERYFFEAMQLLRYDAVGIGEYETRSGLEGRFAAAERYGLPLVSSNILDRARNKPVAPEWIVRNVGGTRTFFGRRGGVRVGVFSVILPSFIYWDGAESQKKYDVVDPKTAALAAVKDLRKRGCDLVIAVSHLGWQNSVDLAREVPGIDVVLNGHREHPRTFAEHVGATVVVDTGEKEWSFTEVSVTFRGDSLVASAADVCGAALALSEDRRFTELEKKYAGEIKRASRTPVNRGR